MIQRLRLAARSEPLALWGPWLVTRSLGAFMLLHKVGWYPAVAGDVDLYRGYARMWQAGLVPYRDMHIEYPPGILPLLRLPTAHFVAGFIVCALVADAVAARSLWSTRSRWGSALWLVAPLCIGPIFWARLDIFVAALLIVGVLAARRDRWTLATVCFSYAGLLKLWPFALAAAVIVLAPATRRGRCFVAGGLLFVLSTLPLMVVGAAPGVAWMLHYQGSHGIEVESVAAIPLQALTLLGHFMRMAYTHGTTEYVSTPGVRLLSVLFDAALLASLLSIAVWFWRRHARAVDIGALLLAIVIALFMTSKILSAQYELWALAAVAVNVDRLAERALRWALAAWTVLLLGATQLVYPFAFTALAGGDPLSTLEALLHGVVVLGFGVRALTALRRLGPMADQNYNDEGRVPADRAHHAALAADIA